MNSQELITTDILKAEKRYNVFKTIILVAVTIAAASVVVWQVNQNTNRTYTLIRCVLTIQTKVPDQVRTQVDRCIGLADPSHREEL